MRTSARIRLFGACALVAVLMLTATPTAAQTAAVSVSGGNTPTDNESNGWRFHPVTQIDVVTLGAWDEDEDGFAADVQVGLWDEDANLLASVTMPAGSSAPLLGGFRYATLANAVRLTAGQTYRIATATVSGSITYRSAATQVFAPQIAFESGCFSVTANTLVYPSACGVTRGLFGPNFQYLSSPPPSFTKTFAPASISAGGISRLTYTIDNSTSDLAATFLDFTDVLPSNVGGAAPLNATNTCSGTFTVIGGNTIGLAGGSVAAGDTCALAIDVKSSVPGAYVSTSAALTSSQGNSGTASATLTVVNLAPTVTVPGAQTVLEDQTLGPLTVTVGDDILAPGSLVVTAESSNTAVVGSVIVGGSGASRSLTITPVANTFGSTTITVHVSDGVSTTDKTIDLTVTSVNDAPSFAAGDGQTVTENAGPQSVGGWATNLSAGAANESSQSLTFQVTNNSNPALFTAGPAIDSTGTLTYTIAANANGVATVTIVLRDDGGTTNGGSDTSAPATFTIGVTSVNNAPSFTAGANQTVLEDAGAQSMAGWASNLSAGPADESGQTLTFQITGNTNSALFSAGPAIDSTGGLTYTPAPNANGAATVTVQLHDDGGTADGGVDVSAPATFTINVTPVNDAPSFVAGANQTVAEDAGPQSVAAWATSLSAGPNESTQSVAFQIASNTNSALFSAGPAIDSTGALTYTPAPNANGTAVMTVRLHDNGGTTDGGVDVSAPASFTITVTAVNDPPTISPVAPQGIAENSALAPVAFQIDDIDQNVAELTVTATSSNAALVPQAALILAGSGGTRTIAATPLPNLSGQTMITLTVNDGTTSAATSFVLTVQAATVPNAPANLVAATKDSTVTLSWTAPATGSPAASYVVEASTTPFGTSLPMATVGATATSFSGAMAEGTYFFRVRGQNSAGLSDPSNEAVASVGVDETPGAPTALLATVDAQHVTLGWQPPAGIPVPTAYRIELGTMTGQSDLGAFETSSATPTLTGTLGDGSYVARVRAKARAMVGAASNEVAFTIGAPSCASAPTAPVMLSPSVAANLITLTWLAPAAGAATSYRLVAGTAPGLSDLLVVDTGSSATSVAASTPAPGTYYVYAVAENACGLSPASNVVAVIVPFTTPVPNAPVQLTTSVAGRTVTLSWRAPLGGVPPTYHLLEAGSAPGLADYAAIPMGAAVTSLTVDAPPGLYYVRVRGITAGGAGLASNEVILAVP